MDIRSASAAEHYIITDNGMETVVTAINEDEALQKYRQQQNEDPQAQLAGLWAALRLERTRRLLATDWTQLADCPLGEEICAQVQAYRQALRDIPQTFAHPKDVIWPESPL